MKLKPPLQVSLITAILIAIGVVCYEPRSSLGATKSLSGDQDIFFAWLSPGQVVDPIYQKEDARLLKICKTHLAECFRKHLQEKIMPLAKVYGEPATSGKPLGEIVGIMKVSDYEYGGLSLGLGFRPAHSQKVQTWIKDAGDWGYGIPHYALDQKKEWVLFPASPFKKPVWVKKKQDSLEINVDSLIGNLFWFKAPIVAVNSKSGKMKKIIPRANTVRYYFLKIENGKIYFRKEIPSDMPCGDEAKEKYQPPSTPTVYWAKRKAFFNSQGAPIIFPGYGKGC